MKIAIMSDSHDMWLNLKKAVELANNYGCEYLLFAGDLIAPTGTKILKGFMGQIIFVWGNNEAEKVIITKKLEAEDNIKVSGDIFEGDIGGIRIFMNHYPRIAELAAKSKEFDLCIHGHTHQYREELVDSAIILNPGEIHGYSSGEACFAIFDTGGKVIERIILNDK